MNKIPTVSTWTFATLALASIISACGASSGGGQRGPVAESDRQIASGTHPPAPKGYDFNIDPKDHVAWCNMVWNSTIQDLSHFQRLSYDVKSIENGETTEYEVWYEAIEISNERYEFKKTNLFVLRDIIGESVTVEKSREESISACKAGLEYFENNEIPSVGGSEGDAESKPSTNRQLENETIETVLGTKSAYVWHNTRFRKNYSSGSHETTISESKVYQLSAYRPIFGLLMPIGHPFHGVVVKAETIEKTEDGEVLKTESWVLREAILL